MQRRMDRTRERARFEGRGPYHGLEGEGLDLLDGLGRPLLEADAVEALVQVDGVLAGDNVGDGGTALLAGRLLGLGGRHFCSCQLTFVESIESKV